MARRRPPSREQKRRWNYKTRYGITPEDFNRMSGEQDGLCSICRTPSQRRLHVDHDHDTGAVRDLLCGRCNTGVGYLENPVWFAQAQDYLHRHHPERHPD